MEDQSQPISSGVPQSPMQPIPQNNKKTGLIVGIVIAVVAVAILIIIAIVFLVSRIGGESGLRDVIDGTGSSSVTSSRQGRDNLISTGQSVTVDISNAFGDSHSATLRVDEVIRGTEALDFINSKMAGSIWEAQAPRDSDNEYLVVKITYTLNSVEGASQLTPARMRAYTGDFEAYPTLIAATFFNDTDFVRLGSRAIDVGETVTEFLIFEVEKADGRPVLSYESMMQDGSDGLWLKLY